MQTAKATTSVVDATRRSRRVGTARAGKAEEQEKTHEALRACVGAESGGVWRSAATSKPTRPHANASAGSAGGYQRAAGNLPGGGCGEGVGLGGKSARSGRLWTGACVPASRPASRGKAREKNGECRRTTRKAGAVPQPLPSPPHSTRCPRWWGGRRRGRSRCVEI